MMYLLDTVAIIRYFSNSGKIGKRAKKVFESFDTSDCEFAISTISFMEIMYLSERKRININLEETLNQISINSGYKIIDLNIEIIKTASKIDFYELHDRMILASAIWMGIPIISSDSLFDNIKEVEVIWD